MPDLSSEQSKKATTPIRRSVEGSVHRRVLVIGGTQFIGRLLVTELLKAGHEVTILHRKPEHPFGKRVHNLSADRNNTDSIRAAVGASKFDAIYDLAYDWERGTTGAQIAATAQLFEGKVGRYIFMSSVACYGDGLNHHEGDALAPDDHPNQYARNKAMSERALFRMHQRGGFPIVTLRPPFVYGPGNPYNRETFFWDRFRVGRPVILPSDGHRLMQFIFVNDLVDLAIKVLDAKNVVGQSFNTANARAVTQHELLLELARVAGIKEPRIVSVPRELIVRAGGQTVGKKLYFGEYYDIPAITQVITKSQRMLGFKPTIFEDGLRLQFRQYLKRTKQVSADFAFDDALLARFSPREETSRSA